MIPGLLIGLQSYTIDYNAVAYRTSVILVEDPGEPALPMAAHPWEYLTDKRDVVRFGLAMSKDTPNILSEDKVNRFFCATAFAYPVDYQNKTIFGDYPYRFNISLLDVGSNKVLSVGDIMDPNSSYGTIRRLVKIKGSSYATINTTNLTYMNKYHYLNGGNDTTQHNFIIVINQNELLTGPVRDPIYQINPATEDITINITNINSTLGSLEPCFSINLSRITVSSVDQNTNTFYTVGYLDNPLVDGIQYNQSFTPPFGVKNNISMILDPSFIPWSNYKLVYVTLPFNLIKTSSPSCPSPNSTGSQFLNNTFTSPFDYNYDPNNVTQADLRDAVLEVDVGSGYRTATQVLIAGLQAKFTWGVISGSPIIVKFTDQSTGSPVQWAWDFGDGNTSTLNSPTHTYALPNVYTVTLTVKDTNGVSSPPTSQTLDLSAPVVGFSGTPLSGSSPLIVQFTDTSTGGVLPTSWKWEYNKTVGGSWTQFSTIQNPSNTFYNGTYDIRLTATNIFGNNNLTKPGYITAIPLAPVASFNTAPSPATGSAPLTVTFTDTSTGGTPTSWNWSFGDGTFSASQNTTHTYTVTGTYTAQLTVSNAGGSSSATKPVSVSIAAPVAAFSGTPVWGLAPLNVLFTDASTGAPTSWKWEYKNVAVPWTQFSTAQNPAFSFPTGTYDIRLTVTNAGGSNNLTKTGYIKAYSVRSFTTVGTSSWTVPANVTSVDYLVVAGGGGGGNSPDRTGGGGGAGGVLSSTAYSVTPGNSYTVIVGAGGNANNNGGNSQFATLTATGGGRGGQKTTGAAIGGSGGGAYHNSADSGKAGTAGQGSAGGNGYDSGNGVNGAFAAGGGGGYSSDGSPGTINGGGNGGNGYPSTISGSSVVYAGGGGGGWQNLAGASGTGGSGGTGGGGTGGDTGTAGTAGAANTGGGGGGGSSAGSSAGAAGGAGGSGIVIIRYY